jgi:hypothetical protein
MRILGRDDPWSRRGRALLLAVLGSFAWAGCGGSTPQPVARVQGRPVSRQQLAHWTAVKRAEAQAHAPAAQPSAAGLRNQALAFLITAYWLEGEAAARGVVVSSTEAEASLRHLLASPAGAALTASLARRHMSNADELFVLRLDELAQKLRAELGAGGGSPAERARRIAAFLTAYRVRWKQRTTCARGYVIAQCRGGPPLPGGE